MRLYFECYTVHSGTPRYKRQSISVSKHYEPSAWAMAEVCKSAFCTPDTLESFPIASLPAFPAQPAFLIPVTKRV
jgi:hypothetical protein